jgi:hypothetical protein
VERIGSTIDGVVYMTITFDKPVYEKIWTGSVDQILSYDTERHEFTVKDVKTDRVRTHMTNLDVLYLSFDKDSFPILRTGVIPSIHREVVAKYMISCGLPVGMLSRYRK